MAIYLIEDLYYADNHAGYKARIDVFHIIKNNYDSVISYNFYKFNLKYEKNRFIRVLSRYIKLLLNYFYFIFFIKNIKNTDTIIVSYPFESLFNVSLAVYNALFFLKKKKEFILIFIALDLDSVRRKSQLSTQNEISILNKASFVITHNEEMSKWLISKGLIDGCLVGLGLFDYLVHTLNPINNLELHQSSSKKIIYAGNLEFIKANFLYNWIPSFQVDLYGINYEPEKSEFKYNWRGVFNAHNPKIDKGGISFGLVWDGDSIHTCEGLVGKYMKISTPHKLSLYLSQGLPVIVWKGSALAEFIDKEELGYSINCLSEISDLLGKTDENKYSRLKNNVDKLSLKLSDGYFLKIAFAKIWKSIN